MTNSDYLIKAAIKKVSEKLNQIFVDKIEEASNIAQDAPEIIRKELDNLKDSIIEEANKMEKETKAKEDLNNSKYTKTPTINIAIEKIKLINSQIEKINKKLNNL